MFSDSSRSALSPAIHPLQSYKCSYQPKTLGVSVSSPDLGDGCCGGQSETLQYVGGFST